MAVLKWAFRLLGSVSVAGLPQDLLDAGFTGSVAVTQTPTSGRGLVAASDVLPGDELLSVPLQQIFSMDTVSQMNLSETLRLENSDLPMADVLASTLAAFRHSETFLITKLLPQEVSHPLFFGPQDWEFADSLVAGNLLKSVKADFNDSWHRVLSGLQVAEDDFRWAQAVLRSRGHSIGLKTAAQTWRSTWGLVPLADLLNMGNDSTVNVDCRTRYPSTAHWGLNGTFSCRAIRSLKKDEELLTQYISQRAHRTGAILLREYGFVPSTADGLSFFPPGCQQLHCAVHVRDIAELERWGDPESFLTAASLKNSQLPMNSLVNENLKLLARHEGKLLADLSREYERRKLPKIFYDLWRSRSDNLTISSSKPEHAELLQLLRDPSVLHTVAWDQAIWDAGQLLLTDWDEVLASELLMSHHDFPPQLELLFRHHRHKLLRSEMETPKARSFDSLLCAFATQAWLNDDAWPMDAEERLAAQAWDQLDACSPAAALRQERQWELEEAIPSCPGWVGGRDLRVDDLYSAHPYPSWRRFGSRAGSQQIRIRRSLIAGAGTGKAILAHLEHYAPEEILAVDLSKRSLQVAKRQLLALGVRNVTFLQCDLTNLEGTFDVIESIGVLHHLPDPSIGLAALKRLLAPDGTMVLGFYSRVARRSIPVMRELAQRTSKEHFRDWLAQAAPEFLGHRLKSEVTYRDEFLAEFSLGSRSNFEDLLFHPVEHTYELPELEALLFVTGLRFNGLRVPAGAGGVAGRWSRYFTPEGPVPVGPGWPQMPLLALLHRIETELEPLLFTSMYVFTASHDTRAEKTSVLSGEGAMARWTEDQLEDALALPLPFEEDWKEELLTRAIAAYCSRLMHFVNCSSEHWISPVPLEAWLEAKVGLGHHAAKVARSLRTADVAVAYCTQVEQHFLGSAEKGPRRAIV